MFSSDNTHRGWCRSLTISPVCRFVHHLMLCMPDSQLVTNSFLNVGECLVQMIIIDGTFYEDNLSSVVFLLSKDHTVLFITN